MRVLLTCCAILLCLVKPLSAENWPAWRGPQSNGLSGDSGLPVEWSSDENVAWKTELPGDGHSSPIIWENSVFVTSCIEAEQKRILLKLDRSTGDIQWQRTVLISPLERRHRLNSFASSTPATDGEKVFVSFLDVDKMFIAAFDFAGNKLWEVRPGVFQSRHGYCSCPVLYKDSIIVNGDHDGEAYLVRLNKTDGSTIWKTPRENKTRSYCTPIILPINGKDQLLLSGSLCTAGYDVETGKQIWVCDGPSEQMVATLVHEGELIFSLGGYPERHLLAIRKGGRGDITDSHIVWRTHRSIPYVPSPLLYDGLLHVVSDEGIYTCFEPQTGDVLLTKRVSRHISSSLVGGDGKIYITDDKGTTTVLKNDATGSVLAKNSIGEDVYSTPAIAHQQLFVRGVNHLFCIGKPARKLTQRP